MGVKFSFFLRAGYDLRRITCHDAIPEQHCSEISYTDFQEIMETWALVLCPLLNKARLIIELVCRKLTFLQHLLQRTVHQFCEYLTQGLAFNTWSPREGRNEVVSGEGFIFYVVSTGGIYFYFVKNSRIHKHN